MYLNTEICAAILFCITTYLGIKRLKRNKSNEESSVAISIKDSLALFSLSAIFLLIFLLQFFGYINYDI